MKNRAAAWIFEDGFGEVIKTWLSSLTVVKLLLVSLVVSWTEEVSEVGPWSSGSSSSSTSSWCSCRVVSVVMRPSTSSLFSCNHLSFQSLTRLGHISDTFRTHFWLILDSFWTHFGHILDTSWTHLGHILDTFGTHLGHSLDTFGTRLGPILDPFWTRLRPVWDPFGTRLGPVWDEFFEQVSDTFLTWFWHVKDKLLTCFCHVSIMFRIRFGYVSDSCVLYQSTLVIGGWMRFKFHGPPPCGAETGCGGFSWFHSAQNAWKMMKIYSITSIQWIQIYDNFIRIFPFCEVRINSENECGLTLALAPKPDSFNHLIPCEFINLKIWKNYQQHK